MAQLGHPEHERESIAIARPDESFVARVARNLSFLDVFMASYFALLYLALYLGTGPGRLDCVRAVSLDVSIFAASVILSRGGILRGTPRELVYRLGMFASLQLSYFQLREILPAVRPMSVDAHLLSFDLTVFGYEPAIAWDRYVTPQTTEWFAFFYFSYFWILAVHVLPMLFSRSRPKLFANFALGAFMVFCCGHLGYMVIPGFGPHHYLEGHFQNALSGGLFYKLQLATVEAGGAQKDIFPSLHTAGPTFFAIFSYMHRRSWPFRYTWPVLAFFASQIILATMFLRWHWLVDIFAGITLATAAALVSRKIVDWEFEKRARLGISPVFTRMTFGSRRRRADDSEKSC